MECIHNSTGAGSDTDHHCFHISAAITIPAWGTGCLGPPNATTAPGPIISTQWKTSTEASGKEETWANGEGRAHRDDRWLHQPPQELTKYARLTRIRETAPRTCLVTAAARSTEPGKNHRSSRHGTTKHGRCARGPAAFIALVSSSLGLPPPHIVSMPVHVSHECFPSLPATLPSLTAPVQVFASPRLLFYNNPGFRPSRSDLPLFPHPLHSTTLVPTSLACAPSLWVL